MQKPIFTTAAVAITLVPVTASPVQARYLQTDPIGYEDDINLYAYVGNDPVNGVDPTGNRYEVTWHQVQWPHPSRHTAIRYTPEPEDQARFEEHPNFQQFDEDGNRYIVFSAGPEGGNLVSRPNRGSDVGPQEGSVRFNAPEGRSELQYFNDLARADGRYRDRLDYDLFPAPEAERSWFVADDSYNSNSYVSGLLGVTGVTPPEIDGVRLDGYDVPVPEECFTRGNDC